MDAGGGRGRRPAYLEALKGELEDKGVAVSTFSDGEALLQSFQVGIEADLMALDWTMPRMAGVELLARLRKAAIKMPIVFLTGRSLVEYEHKALQEGALDFIDKARGVDVLVRDSRSLSGAIGTPAVLCLLPCG